MQDRLRAADAALRFKQRVYIRPPICAFTTPMFSDVTGAEKTVIFLPSLPEPADETELMSKPGKCFVLRPDSVLPPSLRDTVHAAIWIGYVSLVHVGFHPLRALPSS